MKRALFLTMLLMACSQPSSPDDELPLDPSTFSLQIIEGNNQVGVVADTLGSPCIVQVTAPASDKEQERVPVPGAIVNFVVTEGGGHVFAGAALTDTAGKAAERWTLGTIAGSQRMEARAVKSDGTPITYQVFEATAEPGPLASIQASVPDTFLWLGDSLDLSSRITGQDQYSNAITIESIEVDAPQPFIVAGSLVSASAEGDAEITIGSGAALTSFRLVVFADLSRYSWSLTWTDYEDPDYERDGVPVGLDSLRYDMQGAIAVYSDLFQFQPFFPNTDFYFHRFTINAPDSLIQFTFYWKDGEVTVGSYKQVRNMAQAVSMITYDGSGWEDMGFGSVTSHYVDGTDRIYFGGIWGSVGWFERNGPAVMTGTRKP